MRSHALPQQASFTVSGVRKLCMWSSKDKSSTSVEKTYIISIKHIRTATDRIKHEELPKHDYKCRMNGQQLRPSGIWHMMKTVKQHRNDKKGAQFKASMEIITVR